MIFRFSEEEKAEIRAFEEKKKANGITWEDFTARVKAINDKYGEGRGPFDKEKLEFLENEKQEMDYAYIDFVVLMDKFEENRFQDLKTQTKIIADAKKITEEVLIFHYNSYLPEFKKIEEQLAENPIMNIGGKSYNLHFSILLHDGANALFDLIEQKDQEPIFLFNGGSVFEYLKNYALEEHFKRLKGTPGEQKLYRAINTILAKSVYVKHEEGNYKSNLALYKDNMPLYHGRYISITSDVTKRQQVIEPLSNEIVVDDDEQQYIYKLSNAENIKGLNRINTHKLFIVCVAEFTKQNTRGAKENYKVKFPLKDYAALLGYDVLEHPGTTKEEAEKEKKRAAEVLKKARKAINQDLDILFNCSYSWKEKIRGKEEDYKDIRIIGAKGIEKGYIEAELTPSFASYILKHRAMTKYPQALLGIDGNHNNAYYLGLKIAEHWNIARNQEAGTNDILSIRTLLSCVDLPKVQKVREQRASWQQKIFEPLMQALDYLKLKGFLEDYELVKAKSEEMTQSEREAAYKEYDIFEDLYVKYKINEKYK